MVVNMLVGIIGKSGSGKSTLANKLCELIKNAVHIDIDKIGHDILKDSNIVDHIVSIVGDPGVVENGVINRKKVGNIIFNDLSKYEEYYRYTEEIEYRIIDKLIEDNKDKVIILDWILLDKTKYWDLLDLKILVDTDVEIRRSRVTRRDNISEEYFNLREVMKEEYNKSEVDYILDGNNTRNEDLEKILKEIR